MRAILNAPDGQDKFDRAVMYDLGGKLNGMSIQQDVLARYCENCGSESIGAVVYAKDVDVHSDNELKAMLGRARGASREIHARQELFSYCTCPVCGESFTRSANEGFSWYERNFDYSDLLMTYDRKVDDLFKKMAIARKKMYEQDARETVEKLADTANEKYHKVDALIPKTAEIAKATQSLLLYVGHLMRLEIGLYAIKQNLAELYLGKAELKEAILKSNQDGIEIDNSSLTLLKEELEVFEAEHDTFVFVPEADIKPSIRPRQPIKPEFHDQLPKEPEYQTPGLFNKKKIAAENEALKKAYEAELERYRQREKGYQEELEKYTTAYAQYETAMVAWNAEYDAMQDKAKAERLEAVARKEAEYNEKLATIMQRIQEEEGKKEEALKHISAGSSLSEQAGLQLLAEEISEGEKLLESIISTRNELYSYNVIYPKYRNVVALSSFYDYLMAGRCSTLAGAEGAYNLYETESRADLIITKLTDVIASLDKIQDNQYMLYQQMSEVNTGIQELNQSMSKVVTSLAHLEMTGSEMKAYLKSLATNTLDISKNVKSIAENTEITAHCSKISAFYAKRNAELTDALGYMVAFK